MSEFGFGSFSPSLGFSADFSLTGGPSFDQPLSSGATFFQPPDPSLAYAGSVFQQQNLPMPFATPLSQQLPPPENLAAASYAQQSNNTTADAGSFVCAGGGVFGLTGGGCVDSNANFYLYGGVGTPGVSACYGETPGNPNDFLSGLAYQGSAIVGAGYSPNGGSPVVATLVCTPEPAVSATYGVNLNETLSSVGDVFSNFGAELVNTINNIYSPSFDTGGE
jgi:hypothetical protein